MINIMSIHVHGYYNECAAFHIYLQVYLQVCS